jgi:hypothetical protein
MLPFGFSGEFAMMRLSAWLSIAAGAVLGVAQAVRNLDNWANWPTWMLDEAAAAMMIAGGVLALRRGGSRGLTASWGVAAGLYGSALVSHLLALSDIHNPERRAAQGQLTMIIGALLVVAVVGLAMSLAEKPKGATA